MNFEYTWRWFGPQDPISLKQILQTGATGIVSSLHHIPPGEVWSVEEIRKHKKLIEEAGFKWSVVESVPVHEDIKKGKRNYSQYISNYSITLENLASCDIRIVCYNFMPVLDWTRTDLNYKLANGVMALRFDITALTAFDLFILKRKNASDSYSEKQIHLAESYFKSLKESQRIKLTRNIIAGLPGGHDGYSLSQFRESLNQYNEIDATALKNNLKKFLKKVIPVAEKNDLLMCIHPDDPPFPILGLPRVVSTVDDISEILNFELSHNNGLTFCTGSFGASAANSLMEMAELFADRIHFLHLRSVKREEEGTFYEAGHLEGNSTIAGVMNTIISSKKLSADHVIPVRPDHGHKMLFELNSDSGNPGYSLIGRMKGLCELKALEAGLRYTNKSI